MELELLDFRQTLDLLASWSGTDVLVTAHSQASAERTSHTHTVLHGELGSLEMVDNPIDADVESAAGYTVGSAPNGLYMSVREFVHALRLGPSHVTVKFRDGFHFEIRRLD